MPFNLIIPIAADKIDYRQEIPYLFQTDSSGMMPCIRSLMGMDTQGFDSICFTILKIHDELYDLEAAFNKQFKLAGIMNKARLLVLETATANQPETIVQTIKAFDLKGAFMVKDADSYFSCEVMAENSVAIFPLDALKRVNPQDKSYVTIDEGYFITNIIEKKVLSRYFCAGGYVFENADTFLYYADKLKENKQLYLSHIIYAMLLDKNVFRPKQVKAYQDWGTKEDWVMNNK